ncbi:hypothetical protein Dda_7172 [Drechslerella dactyloides]|uniref:Thiamine pyrophosphokinase n=1 Tax=Drechslerella dactyloides TaxID=74499 RepID=A0AAD6ITK2_DREDA|nr:hypothetical protein Dda_7172 [Drechslerella dactyloides]
MSLVERRVRHRKVRRAPDHVPRLELEVPDCITGDLDSIKPYIGTSYRAVGVTIVPDHSQYDTDFTKSLNWIDQQEEKQMQLQAGEAIESAEQFASPDDAMTIAARAGHPGPYEPMDVVAYGATGGRVDQGFHSIDQLFHASRSRAFGAASSGTLPEGKGPAPVTSQHRNSEPSPLPSSSASFNSQQPPSPRRRLTLMTADSVTFLLEKGRNVIETPTRLFGKTCGLIPVAGPSVITTQGLEWDLTDAETRFGGMVSTSNHLAREQVEVVTTAPLLFTMEIRRAR